MNGSNLELGDTLAAAVERAQRSVVQVAAPRRTSGTVWSDDLVVAAAHALHGDDAQVLLHDGDECSATVIGRDPAIDLAVLRVAGGGLAPIGFVEPGRVKVGHLALALGRPARGLGASLRMVGRIAHDVPTRLGSRIARWIETDRALPPGFSGGPLVDGRGDAIGMSTAGLVRGAHLALSHDELARAVEDIVAYGQVRRGWLGIAVRPSRLSDAVAERAGQRSGAVVIAVAPGGPADQAGLRAGDVICSIEGCPVKGPEDLVGLLRPRIDVTLRVAIVRAGALDERLATTVARAA